MSEITWTNMNDNLMALLEAVLTLAASDAATAVPRRPTQPAIKPGGYSEDIFLDLTAEEQNEFSCSICYQVLKDSMQCVNQHKFCHSCVYVWSTTGQYANRVRCPVCRCHGYYLHNDDVDEKIGKKRVKCAMEGCRWTGPLKLLKLHRHTNYGGSQPSSTSRPSVQDESDDSDEDGRSARSSVLELPYLGRAPPRLPHHNISRFNGTGLRARSMITTVGAAAAAAAAAADPDDSSIPTIHITTTRLDGTSANVSPTVGGGGGVLLRERRNTGTSTEASTSGSTVPQRSSVRQRMPPIRRGVNRISVIHTDSNNNLADTTSTTASSSNSSIWDGVGDGARRSLFSPEGVLPLSSRQPRPPTGPRPLSRPPSHRMRRNLQSISLNSSTEGAGGASHAAEASSSLHTAPHVIRAPPTFSADSVQDERHQYALGAFQDRLRDSRNRLEGLMTTFSSELERSRQEMADFQVERERQRREQLTEVRELGHRLGQVANELRYLLNHRRIQPSDSSSSSDE